MSRRPVRNREVAQDRLPGSSQFITMIRKCINCSGVLKTRHQKKFCSSSCQQKQRRKIFIANWKRGEVSGTIGISVRVTSAHIRNYLLETSSEKCALCEWQVRNPLTGRVPLEVDHIDGDAENNIESNLRLLCPNCHSLTPHFRNLNKGHSRKWRMNKYIKNGLSSQTSIIY